MGGRDRSRVRGLARWSAALAFVLGGFPVLAAQGPTGAVSGRVNAATDSAAVDGAVVAVQGTLLRARTEADGSFRLSGLAPGQYTLQVLALGFRPDSVTGVRVTVGEVALVRVVLVPAPVGMEDLVVSASRAPEASRLSAASVTVLANEEVTRRNVVTLDEALQYQPGVTFNGSTEMDIRGSSGIAKGVGSRVLLMLDGHPVLSGDGSELDFYSLPLLDLERVEVVKGAYSAAYGSNALGGVTNIFTTPVGERPRTTIRAYGGLYQPQEQYRYTSQTLNYQGIGLQHSRRLGGADGVGVRVYLGRDASDGFKENGEESRWLGRLKVTSRSDTPHPWDLYAVFAQEKVGQSLYWRSDSQPYQVPPGTVGDYEFDYKLLTGGSWEAVARPNLHVRLSPYVNYNSVQNYFSQNSNYHRATRAGASLQATTAVSGSSPVTFGMDAAFTQVHLHFTGDTTVPGDSESISDPHIIDAAGFAQWDPVLGGRLKGSIGFRIDYHRSWTADSVTVGRREVSVSPKFGLVYSVSQRLTARASIGHGYRAPSAIEQFVHTFEYGVRVIPNPQLKGEQAWSGELGFTALPSDRLRFDAAVFQSNYRDQIGPSLVRLFPDPEAQFQNISRATVRGLDVGARANLVPNLLDAELTYLLLDATDDSTGQALPYRSRHNLTATLNAWHAHVGVDVRYRSAVEQVLAFQGDPRKPWTVVDLRLSTALWGATLQGKVSNLLNTFYVDVSERNPGAPRSFAVTVFTSF